MNLITGPEFLNWLRGHAIMPASSVSLLLTVPACLFKVSRKVAVELSVRLLREDGWTQKTGSVLFGRQEKEAVYAGTSSCAVTKVSKAGELLMVYRADDSLFSCTTSGNGRFVFAGDSNGYVYCFSEAGDRLWIYRVTGEMYELSLG